MPPVLKPCNRLSIIRTETCNLFGVPIRVVESDCHTQTVFLCRNVMFYLACKLAFAKSFMGYSGIARFYNCTPQTVLNGMNHVNGWLAYNAQLKRQVEQLYGILLERFGP